MIDGSHSKAHDSFYRKIREKNEYDFGHLTGKIWERLFTQNLYSNKTHFVYELLQNAEDACARAKKAGQNSRFYVRFVLKNDRLEVRNNGIPFDEKDVIRISRMAMPKETEDVVQIGKFGIGFKSVYEYTSSPEIYSGDYSFYIIELFKPYPKKHREDVQSGETIFVLPFNSKRREQKLAYQEIKKRLENLELRNLLFLKNIEEISYRIESRTGKYVRYSKVENGVRLVSLQYIEGSMKRIAEDWLIIEKPCTLNNTLTLEVAYLLKHDKKLNRKKVVSARNTKLFVYFPTEKETRLKFLIHGPFNTNTARDNIIDDEWNKELIKETSILVSESITQIKTLNLLNVDFLNTLPIETDDFVYGENFFEIIYEAVKEKLISDAALLPTRNGRFVSSKKAFLGRSEALCNLLSSKHLDFLFSQKESQWLDKNITEDRTPNLWEYLTKVIGIEVIGPNRFANIFNEEFISKQTDQWVISFYTFLLTRNALWKTGTIIRGRSYDRPGPLRSKPIIRLQDNNHVVPFKYFRKPNVYLPHIDPNRIKIVSNVVKDVIVRDEKAKKFLQKLGIKEPDEIIEIIRTILPKYAENVVSKDENIEHLSWIFKTFDKLPDRSEVLKKQVKITPLLDAVNASNGKHGYRKPNEIYLGIEYTGTEYLNQYFEGNEDVWFLDDRYLLVKNYTKDELKKKFEYIDCYSAPRVHVTNYDCFDPECEIEGLEYALQNITFEKSRIIWDIAKQCCKIIRNDDPSYEKYTYSKMGKLLIENKWLPKSKSSSFHKPSELKLSELAQVFDKYSFEGKYLAEKLGFIPDLNVETQKILEKIPEDIHEEFKTVFEVYTSLSPEKKRQFLDIGRKMKHTEDMTKLAETGEETPKLLEVSPTPQELEQEFRNALKVDRPTTPKFDDKTWKGPNPDVEEKIREQAEHIISEQSKKPNLIEKGRKLINYSKTRGKEESVLKEFLLELYDGHCQICNTKLDLGPNKNPWVDIYRLFEKRRGLGNWSNQEYTILGLCPNCHALMKWGDRDLQELWEIARTVYRDGAPRWEVKERRGDFYIIPISIVMKKKELFIAPVHMAMISSFLKWMEDSQRDKLHTVSWKESQKIYPYICTKCGKLHSKEDYKKDRFCKKCKGWLHKR